MNDKSKRIYMQGVRHYNAKEFDKALTFFSILPENNIILFNIATCYKQCDRFEEAIPIYKRLIKCKVKDAQLAEYVNGNYISSVTMLVKRLTESCKYEEALVISEEAITVLPKCAILVYNIGHLLKVMGNHDRALEMLKRSIALNPLYFDGYIEQINIYNDSHRYANSVEVIEEALKFMPESPKLYNEYGVVLCRMGRMKDGFEMYDKGLKSKDCLPFDAGKIFTNIGNAYSHIGDVPKSLENSKKGFTVDEGNTIAMQNYLMNMLYVPNISFNSTLREHFETGMKFAKQHRLPAAKIGPYVGPLNEKIHIGYVSGDFFGQHPMTLFLKALLTRYDRSKFEVFCYSVARVEAVTGYSDDVKWRNVKYLSKENIISLIHADRIDVLMDLAGHTAANRLDVFSNRIARLQLSYLGYPCITGMPDIDYYIIDKTFRFRGMKTASMPHCFTHFTPTAVPPAEELVSPYRENGYVTFGTLNKLAKVNAQTVELWDSILTAYPTARLVLRRNYVFKLKNQDRVVFVEHTATYDDHIKRYNKIDIALDTWPYSGTTTTCESLLMGVPVLTLSERKTHTIHHNVSASILINSGMPECDVENVADFIGRCGEMAERVQTNPEYKKETQRKFLTGHVTNAAQYVADYEELIRQLLH